MAGLKYSKDGKEWVALRNYSVNNVDVLQTTGTSTDGVMSQKAVTDALAAKADKGDATDYLKGSVTSVTISSNGNNAFPMPELNEGEQRHIILVNGGSEDYTVAFPTSGFKTPDGEPLEITVPKNGYAEVNFIKVGGTTYARGL